MDSANSVVPFAQHHNHGSSADHTSYADHDGHAGNCKTEMLWNWNTIDSCFLTSSWRITSTAMFAGSCIGVFLLAIIAVLLRRLTTEYDAFLVRRTTATNDEKDGAVAAASAMRPTVMQQLVRSVIFAAHGFLSYVLML
ncbi:Ctr copper transporter family-domain-containing protein [Truncatella angustata]|uniref:Copper transport protein n=1 Tax=Truncatella angustata TaxID=152316 RepID=A0A9P8ZZ97_9PEZI|nr:Ctr copper transporter family-domain-containing protein [Truncatella angustata]KAH6657002.1 Ctr copper transporter family-domain-containing protein [Truncatella angustata]